MANKKLIGLFFAICFISGFLIMFFNYRPRMKLGDNYLSCNPGAKVKTNRIYQLRLWDTNWPVLEAGGYKAYLERLVRDFQKIYPNIKVAITLFDLGDGPTKLAAALKTNAAPDVYCSAFDIPVFDLRRQIPVGFYLKREEKEAYFPEARKLVQLYGVECYFPRWLAPTIWIGNKLLFDRVGLPVLRMQRSGYFWEELVAGAQKLPCDKFILVGNLGHNGFFTDLAINFATEVNSTSHFLPPSGIVAGLNHLNNLVIQKKIPVNVEPDMLGQFMAGNSLVLAGVRPIIYRFLKLKLAGSTYQEWYEPILLPSPSIGVHKFLLTESGIVGIYRNKWSTGDDQITAAVKLGEFISTYEKTEPFQEMMLIPAAKKSAAEWSSELDPVIGDMQDLIKQVENSSLLNLPQYLPYQKEIYPVLQEFFAKKADLERVKAQLVNVKW